MTDPHEPSSVQQNGPPRRSLGKRVLFAIVTVALVLVVAEIALRVLRPGGGTFLLPDARLGYVNAPGFEGRWGVTRSVTVKIDERGFRVPKGAPVVSEGEARSGSALRIACLGDSCTFGFDVEAEEAYPELFAAAIREERPELPVEVLNAGVIGYSSRHGLRLLEERILGSEPDVITVAYNVANRVARLDSRPGLDETTFWTSDSMSGLTRKSALLRLAYDLGLRRFSSSARRTGWIAEYRKEDDPLYAEKARLVLGFEDVPPFVPIREHEELLVTMAELARKAGARLVLLTFGESPRVGGAVERAQASLAAGRAADAAREIESYFEDDKSDLDYTNNLDILASRIRLDARREANLERGRGELRFPSARDDLGGVLVRTQSEMAAATERAAQRGGVTHLDLREPMNARPEVFLDYVHFGPSGHAVVAEALMEWFRESESEGK